MNCAITAIKKPAVQDYPFGSSLNGFMSCKKCLAMMLPFGMM